jgi:uncharacterized protein with PIN domain
MKSAFFRFYSELNDFLPKRMRAREFLYGFEGRPTVKHVIESIGVPHTEIDLILVNGISVDFGHYLEDRDRVSVYPVFERLDIHPIVRLRSEPLRKTAFILDVHLGKLARMLRLLGFDALYRNDYEDAEIIAIGADERRIVLTRDRQLLKAKAVTHGYWIRSLIPEEQIEGVLHEFDLFTQIQAFQRCVSCNGRIRKTTKELVMHLLEPKTKQYYEEFFQCADCGRVFWKGSHFPKLKAKIDRWMVLGANRSLNG